VRFGDGSEVLRGRSIRSSLKAPTINSLFSPHPESPAVNIIISHDAKLNALAIPT
jgi:hypothetical protein